MLTNGLNRRPLTRTACALTVCGLAALTIPLAGFGRPAQAANARFSRRFEKSAMSAESVARIGHRAFREGRVVAIAGPVIMPP